MYPSNMDDVIDSRDVIEAIGELEGEIQSLILSATNPNENASWGDASWVDVADANIDAADGINVLPESMWPDGDYDHAEIWTLATELVTLRKLASQAESYAADWQYGEQLIRDSYFEEYARETVEECYVVPDGWPFSCIDWEQAARELQMDYTSVDFDGVEYWIR